MANRFPLIVNPDTKEIQEIAQNDNLDLTGNGVYAGGSLGSNGQVLTTNGTSVEWRTVTGGGGGGGGIDSDTTYIVETEDQADGASLNLVAGGSGIGTIKIKFQDSDQLQFDTTDNLTIAPSIKAGSITNNQLENPNFVVTINGVQQTVNLGDGFTIPIYGDVFTTGTQTVSDKTFSNCIISGLVNTFQNIPNTALENAAITINGNPVALGGSVNITGSGGADTDTTYTISAKDVLDTNSQIVANRNTITLTDSNSVEDSVTLIAGDRISISRSGDEITITGTEINTNDDTKYSTSTDTYLVGNLNSGARINLSGTDNTIDSVNLINGTGVTVNSPNDNSIQFSIAQDVSPTSNVTFNSVTIDGSLTVNGATTYVDTTNLVVSDKTITIADGVTSSLNADGAGILLGTSNVNLIYNHDTASWQSTSNMNLVATKSYKIGGNVVLSETKVLGKSLPLGDIIGTTDQQSLSNKTLNNPIISTIINQGTLTLPSPTVADTLVGRATQDILTNKQIDGATNTISNIANSSLVHSVMTINGTQRALGDTFTISAEDPYDDEKAQDAAAAMFTTAVHTGIGFTYDDTTGRLTAVVSAVSNAPVAIGYINLNGSSPTWSGTSGYSVSHSGGGGSDEVYTLTFPSAYSARTDYIVNTTYDGTDWVPGNDASLGVARFSDRIEITVRRWNEDPLSTGDVMVTIYDL